MRKAAAIKTTADMDAFRQGKMLPVEMLQPVLVQKVWPAFLRGDYETAVFQAFKEVEVAVRKAANAKGAGYGNDLLGTKLMHDAFNKDAGPLRNVDVIPAEQIAGINLFAAPWVTPRTRLVTATWC